MKARLVESHRERLAQDRARRDHGGRPEQLHRDRGLAADRRRRRRHPHPRPRGRARARSRRSSRWRAERDEDAVEAALADLAEAAARRIGATSCRRRSRRPRRAPRPASGPGPCARCSATTGRPTGVGAAAAGGDDASCSRQSAPASTSVSERIGHRPRILVGKPGLDGHSNGAEQIAVRARDVGMEVVYQGIRLTPEQIAASAVAGGRRRGRALDPLRLPSASWSPRRVELLRERGRRGRRWWSAGSSPRPTPGGLREAGVARRLHAQGLRRQPDHGRDRRPRRRAPRERLPGARLTPPGSARSDPRLNPPDGNGGATLTYVSEMNGDRSAWLRCYRCWSPRPRGPGPLRRDPQGRPRLRRDRRPRRGGVGGRRPVPGLHARPAAPRRSTRAGSSRSRTAGSGWSPARRGSPPAR